MADASFSSEPVVAWVASGLLMTGTIAGAVQLGLSWLVWGVFAATSKLPPRTLAGTYVGAAGDASFVVGAGANVLVGGSNRSVSLSRRPRRVRTRMRSS
mgnify:CR=1 FL=1